MIDAIKLSFINLLLRITGLYFYEALYISSIKPIEELTFKLDNGKHIYFYLYLDSRITYVYRFGFFFKATNKVYLVKVNFDNSLDTSLIKFNNIRVIAPFITILGLNNGLLFKAIVNIFLDHIYRVKINEPAN